MKATIKGFIYAEGTRHFDMETMKSVEGPDYHFCTSGKIAGTEFFENYALVCPHEIVFEIPEKFDPREQLVKGLEKKKQKLMAEFNARVTEIDRQIQTYLAIEA